MSTILRGPNPSGLCLCGCRAATAPAQLTSNRLGNIKGQPQRYLPGHHTKKKTAAFVIDAATGCWNWQRCRNTHGYGSTAGGGKKTTGRATKFAHRLFYEKLRGRIPPGMTIDHLCKNKSCVNPNHMEAVPQYENVRRGDQVKLSMDVARRIRADAMSGKTFRQLGKTWGISTSHAFQVVKGICWKEKP